MQQLTGKESIAKLSRKIVGPSKKGTGEQGVAFRIDGNLLGDAHHLVRRLFERLHELRCLSILTLP